MDLCIYTSAYVHMYAYVYAHVCACTYLSCLCLCASEFCVLSFTRTYYLPPQPLVITASLTLLFGYLFPPPFSVAAEPPPTSSCRRPASSAYGRRISPLHTACYIDPTARLQRKTAVELSGFTKRAVILCSTELNNAISRRIPPYR